MRSDLSGSRARAGSDLICCVVFWEVVANKALDGTVAQ